MENGAFSTLTKSKCSIFHNTFEYVIFQRHQKALLWSKAIQNKIDLSFYISCVLLHPPPLHKIKEIIKQQKQLYEKANYIYERNIDKLLILYQTVFE